MAQYAYIGMFGKKCSKALGRGDLSVILTDHAGIQLEFVKIFDQYKINIVRDERSKKTALSLRPETSARPRTLFRSHALTYLRPLRRIYRGMECAANQGRWAQAAEWTEKETALLNRVGALSQDDQLSLWEALQDSGLRLFRNSNYRSWVRSNTAGFFGLDEAAQVWDETDDLASAPDTSFVLGLPQDEAPSGSDVPFTASQARPRSSYAADASATGPLPDLKRQIEAQTWDLSVTLTIETVTTGIQSDLYQRRGPDGRWDSGVKRLSYYLVTAPCLVITTNEGDQCVIAYRSGASYDCTTRDSEREHERHYPFVQGPFFLFFTERGTGRNGQPADAFIHSATTHFAHTYEDFCEITPALLDAARSAVENFIRYRTDERDREARETQRAEDNRRAALARKAERERLKRQSSRRGWTIGLSLGAVALALFVLFAL